MTVNILYKLKLWVINYTICLLRTGEEVLVGGQAVIEGVMMRSRRSYSVAVRRQDGSIAIKKDYIPHPSLKDRLRGIPVIRGILTLGQAFTLGIRALKFSTDEKLRGQVEQCDTKHRKAVEPKELSSWVMAFNICLAVLFFVLLFKMLPLVLASQLQKYFRTLNNPLAFSFIDGSIRIAIFLTYILLLAKIRDVRRIFEYHGAEHKVVFTFEAHEELTVQNARKYSTLHPRCGTSFLMVVMLTSTLVYALIPFDSFSFRLLSRILLIPIVAGFSYEIIRIAARNKNFVLKGITLPGLWLQKVTTREPSDDQLEVAIRALNEALLLENVDGELAVV
jgi:uncharacterized protein YqhQ